MAIQKYCNLFLFSNWQESMITKKLIPSFNNIIWYTNANCYLLPLLQRQDEIVVVVQPKEEGDIIEAFQYLKGAQEELFALWKGV